MVKRALLIASQTAGLRGCDGDVALMTDVLARWEFECTSLTDGAATQAGILTAYRSLIDQAQAGDSVVVYYSGHGGRIRDLTSVNETTNAYFQFIVPTDYEDSTNDHFRGILADELRALQLELTTRTDNVTTILDCCHSALMSRDPALVARFLQRPWAELQRGARARQEHASADVRRVLQLPGIEHGDSESNQRAVRMVACLPTESAFERPSEQFGEVHGLFTEGLVGVLSQLALNDESEVAVTWDDVAAAVRSWVLARAAQQHVLVEGPARRRPFSSEQTDATRGWPVDVSAGVLRIPGAAVLGIGPGDVVSLVPALRKSDLEPSIEATVVRLDGGRAVLELADGTSSGLIDAATVAYSVTITTNRQPVVVEGPEGPIHDLVKSAISKSLRLEPVDAATTPLAHVVVDDSGMMLVNQDGMDQYAQGRPVEPAQLERLTNDLEHLAKVATLRGLVSGTADEALEIPTAFTVHATPSGPALESGSTLPQGVVYLRAHHLGKPSDPPVFANIVNVGQVGDVNVLSGESSPTGIVLTAQQTVQLDGDVGTELYWPEELPKDEPRPETFFAVFSDAELDIRSIASAGIALRSAAKGNFDRSGTLQHVVDLAASGTSRSARRAAAGEPPIRYHVHHFEFLLEPGFQVDESAAPAGGARGGGASVNIAVRLLDCVVRRNRRAMYSTDIRLDAVFITGGGSDNGIRLETRTWTSPRIADGDRVSADELVLYSGPAQDFLEVAIWVSRANQANPNLAELIGMSLQNQTPTSSTGGLLPLVADADRFAVTEGINAVGTVVEAVGRILRQAVNRSIGLYRTTLLVPEDLTPGRRPTEGFRETQDMKFAYDIVVQD